MRWEVWTRDPHCSGCPACAGVLPCRQEDHGRHTVAAARVVTRGREAGEGRTVLFCLCGAVSISHAPGAFHEAAGSLGGPQGGTTPMSVRFVNPLGVAEESEAGYLETTGAQRSKEHRA